MELRLRNKTANKLEIEVIGENDTLLNLLKQKLLQDPSVETATYVMGHPYLDNPLFVVETKNGKPDAALKTAAKELRAQFDELETLLVRASGQ
ncbi:MAG: DNA-directed polymerase subunit [Thermoplasmata archaeon]|jgi:DNA-directed RNA polymerase subunit L|nr:DNA-directed polymerase subunit [Thermoplasmata archaeon]